jgi:glycosyltransferase involved in cell wall biosynthesis
MVMQIKMQNSKILNILFIIYDLERGGPELRLLDFAKYFSNKINIFICVTSENLALLDAFYAHNVSVRVVPITKGYLSILKIIDILSFYKSENIHIVNLYDLKGFIIAFFMKFLTCFNLKCVYHNVNALVGFSKPNIYFFSLLFRICNSSCICNSNFSRCEISRIVSKNKIVVINNGIDFSYFKKSLSTRNFIRSSLDIGPNDIVLGTLGNFRKQKNYPFLLNAFSKLATKYSNLKLLCIGGGEYLKWSKLFVKTRNLEKNVIFTDYSKYVKEYLNAIDIFVFPSLWEGFPNALLQAMSMEIPVLASNVGGCREIVRNLENGMLFRSEDMKEFLEKVEILINNRKLAKKLGQMGRKSIVHNFSMNRMINNYQDFYRKLARN